MERIIFACITWAFGVVCGFSVTMSVLSGLWLITIISALIFGFGAIFFVDKDVAELIRQKIRPRSKY